MPIDIDSISPQAKARYIEVGQRYSSEDTLGQADATLTALATYAAPLVATGFATKDGTKLAGARDGLLAGGVQRKSAQAAAIQQRTAFGTALSGGKDERASARSVLLGARRDLDESVAPEAVDAVAAIDAALQKTASSGGSPTELANQLGLLQQTLSNAAVAVAAADRGGPAAVSALAAAIQSVQGTKGPAKRGTPAETERLDLFDGIIVELCRAARKAARVAARKAGTPALAKAFTLDHLDGRAAAPAPSAPPAPPPPVP